MKILVQPDDGLQPIWEALGRAKRTIEVVIFRFDRREIEGALADAVRRGVVVRALIAHTNHAGEALLRKLELRLLAAGVMVARTAGDLTRYHSKIMIIDRRELFVLAFNYTRLDIDRSRSFGIATKDRKIVQEALKLFEADGQRQPYEAGSNALVVSPVNARPQLTAFLKGAKQELLIYDLAVHDLAMVRLLEQRARDGVTIRILGRVKSTQLEARVTPMRLHTRTIIRDRHTAFIGSQSLRRAELEDRREVGLIFKDAGALARLCAIFDEDWSLSTPTLPAAKSQESHSVHAGKVAKKTAQVVVQSLAPLAPRIDEIVREMNPGGGPVEIDGAALELLVADAVKTAVKVVVKQAVKDAVEEAELHA
ncbi:phospholipase D-like domain-containing protein [Bryobacter aggregatus]|uniref:phospholipase D-like domain-containing protein n=1 Tax=Bryobacter aggregatus TaxID=360054 RepID=UPI00138DE9C7|nr:phospholipase D-like domain-containing protein [Bryobacter aggregatus]